MFFEKSAFNDLKRTAAETNAFDPNMPEVPPPPKNEGFFKQAADAFRYQRASGNTTSATNMFWAEMEKDWEAIQSARKKVGFNPFEQGTIIDPRKYSTGINSDEFGRKYEELRARYPQAAARSFEEIRNAVGEKVENLRLEAEMGSDGVLSKAGGFMGTMAGAMTDPVNLAFMVVGAPPGASLARVLLTEAAAGAASELIVQKKVREFNESIGNPYGLKEQAENVGYAVAGSVALPLVGRGVKGLYGYVKALAKEKGAALNIRGAARSIEEKEFIDGTVPGAEKEKVGEREILHEQKLNEAEARIKEETKTLSDKYDETLNNPNGDPYDLMVSINPEDIDGADIVRGQTSWLNMDGTRTSINGAKSSGFGLVKFIFYHGEKGNDIIKLTKDDVVAFPRIIREYEPTICKDGSREWVVQRSDGYKVLYTDKVWAEDGKRRVVSMYVLTEKDAPLSKRKKPIQSLVNRSEVFKDTSGAFPPGDSRSVSVPDNITSQGENVQPVFVDDYKLTTRYEVVDLDDLKTSDAADYPAELQPRDRSRQASADQVGEISRNLDPERLGRHTDADRGAPIVSPEGFVESGNGRTMAIRKAYEENPASAARYRDMVEAEAKTLGVDTSGMKHPVLIRRRLTDLTPEERLSFVEAANRGTSLDFSASEKAMLDAQKIDDDLLNLYQGGDLSQAKNAEFVRQFRKAAVAQGDLNRFTTPSGLLSDEGIKRIRNALFAKAYGDMELAGYLFESADVNIKSIGAALNDAAVDFAKLKENIKAGIVAPEYDITKSIIDAVNLVRQARAAGETVADAVAQLDLFAPDNGQLTGILKTFFRDENFKRPVSAEKTAEALKRYAKAARAQRKDQLSMFDVSQSPDQILGEGLSKIKEQDALLSPDAKETADFLKAKEAVEQVRIDAEMENVKSEVGKIADPFDRSALEAGADGADFADKLLNEATTCRF